MSTPCEYCAAIPPLRFTYNFANLCCAVRYLRNTPESRRQATLELMAKKHDIEVLQMAMESS